MTKSLRTPGSRGPTIRGPLLRVCLSTSRFLRLLLRWQPAPRRYRTASIAAICTASPILIGAAAQRTELGLIASCGSLAALYGGAGPARRDALVVAGAAFGVLTAFVVGSTAAGHTWSAVLVTSAWSAVITVLCAVQGARPPGITMFVLVCSVATGMTTGSPGETVERALAVAAVGALATLLTWAGSRATQYRSHGIGASQAGPRAQPLRDWNELCAGPIPWMAARTALAVAAAGALAVGLRAHHPYWAMATAAAVLSRGTHATSARERALLRGAGTAAGCVLAGALTATHPDPVATAVLLAAFTFAAECLIARNYALAMLFVTPMAVLLVTAGAPSAPGTLSVTSDRLVQTVTGASCAAVAGLLVRRSWAVRQRLRAVVGVLTATAAVLEPSTGTRNEKESRPPCLEEALHRLLLVSERTSGERRSVRQATAALDDLADRTTNLARSTLRQRVPGTAATERNQEDTRAVALIRSLLAQLRHYDEARVTVAEHMLSDLAAASAATTHELSAE